MSKLREILLANRIDLQMAYEEKCPFCQNQNPHCEYFSDVIDTLGIPLECALSPKGERGQLLEDSFWIRLKQELTGTYITVTTAYGENEIDLGTNMHVGYYYLDLYEPLVEISLLSAIAKKFGFLEEQDEKKKKTGSMRFMAVPMLVFQPSGLTIQELDEEIKDAIDLEYMLAMDNVAAGIIEEVSRDYQWLAVYFDAKKQEVIYPDEWEENQPNAIVLLNWKQIYGWGEFIYRRLADIEERLVLKIGQTTITPQVYECSNLKTAWQDFIKEWEGIRTDLKTKILF